MNQTSTLDPPGSIAVIGAGPLGIEAALYGRYLGYNVTLLEAHEIGQSMITDKDAPLPMLPDRCLSPLAVSALTAQKADHVPLTLPVTIGQWIDDALVPLTQTDLLHGRVRVGCPVIALDFADASDDNEDEGASATGETEQDDEPPPPDFLLTLQHTDGSTEQMIAEAVIVATGKDDHIKRSFETPAEYHFAIGRDTRSDDESSLRLGRQEIVRIFATLADRETLDLYRPLRG